MDLPVGRDEKAVWKVSKFTDPQEAFIRQADDVP